MSIRSQLQNKAVAMAEAMAERAHNPQAIDAIRQRLVAQIQAGELPPYVGIPLVQDLTQKLTQAQQQMAQMVAGMGTPPAPQGAPIAQQVMAQAQQGAGVEALPSNLPQSYAPGGLVAFAEGGEVERYNGLFPEGSLIGRVQRGSFQFPEGSLLGLIQAAAAGDPEAQRLIEQERQKQAQAKPTAGTMPGAGYRRPGMAGDERLLGATPPAESVGMEAERARNMALVNAPADTGTAPAAPAAPAAPTIPGVRMPQVNLPTLTLPTPPIATDFTSFTKKLPDEARAAFDAARSAEEKYLRGLTEPGEQAREKRFGEREAALEKDSAMGRALNLMSLGFGIAGSKERTLAGALGNEGRQGIQALIQGEAANRVAKERLDDARDNFEQQKVAARKGDRAAATAAGQRAADDMRAYAGLNMQAAQAGSHEAMQRFQTEQQGKLGQAQLQQQGALGVAGLDLQRQQIAQQGALGMQQLQLGRDKLKIIEQQIAAGDKRAAAALAGAQQKAYAAFQSDPQTRMLLADLQKKYGNLQHPEAQRQLQQARNTYMMNAVPTLLGSSSGASSGVKDVADLLKD